MAQFNLSLAEKQSPLHVVLNIHLIEIKLPNSIAMWQVVHNYDFTDLI